MNKLIKDTLYTLLSPILIRKGKSDCVYITFDDGPHPENTDKLLNAFKKVNGSATFFMLGKEMENYPDVVQRVVKAGHDVGYHSYKHDSMKKISFSELKADIAKIKQLEKKLGIRIKYYRPPYGDLSLFGLIHVITRRLKVIMWSLDSRDSFDKKEQILENLVHENIKPGEILLFHDDYDLTVDLMPDFLDEMQKTGLKISKLSG